MGTVQVPVTCLCDHSFSKSMAACASGEGCVPVEVRSVSHSAMNSEMTGCRYRAVVLPICVFDVGDFVHVSFKRESCL